MTTYFEHNAGSKEPFEPRRQDVVEWPGIVATHVRLTPEEAERYRTQRDVPSDLFQRVAVIEDK
jgi:hypothetical protein